jgi:hypothetical protein
MAMEPMDISSTLPNDYNEKTKPNGTIDYWVSDRLGFAIHHYMIVGGD